MKRGDVVLVWFPHRDQETFKRRPALVVQRDDLGTGIPQIVVAMITANLSRLGHPSRVELALSSPGSQTSGLLTDSVVMTDNLATLAETAIASVIGRLSDMAEVDVALRRTLAL
jgi:mRNA interferase MazF